MFNKHFVVNTANLFSSELWLSAGFHSQMYGKQRMMMMMVMMVGHTLVQWLGFLSERSECPWLESRYETVQVINARPDGTEARRHRSGFSSSAA